MAVVTVSRRGADRVRTGHPWIYRSDVMADTEVAPGDLVAVVFAKLTGTTSGVDAVTETVVWPVRNGKVYKVRLKPIEEVKKL